MSDHSSHDKTCVIIGASHAGVNLAFSLRKEGWKGEIILFDKDPILPYHRPPLSKAYLSSGDTLDKYALKSAESYEKEDIALQLGFTVASIRREEKTIVLTDGSLQRYDKLVLATGARPLIPSIPGLETANNVFALRTAADVKHIRKALQMDTDKRVVVIGGGYIGLEIAASLRKLGAAVSVLEREERVLARVTAPEMSDFFQGLHTDNGVDIHTSKNVVSIAAKDGINIISCSDGSSFTADILILGVGIRINKELAEDIGLDIENGIKVNASTCTSDDDIYAIGDCTYHYNPHYDRFVRLESVQNAVDQAKVAAAALCDKAPTYDAIPWFWSDQYNVKLQMVGLSNGYTQSFLRKEDDEGIKFSFWYFKGDELLAVDAVNNAKAYVIGTKFIKENKKINKTKLMDTSVPLKPANLL